MAIKQNNNITPQFDLGTTNIRKMYYGSSLVYDPSIPPAPVWTPPGSPILYTNPALSYPGSGTTYNDLSGNGNNGTFERGATWTAGTPDYVALDGQASPNNDYIQYTDAGDTYNKAIFITWVYLDNIVDSMTFTSKWIDTGQQSTLWCTSQGQAFYAVVLDGSNNYLDRTVSSVFTSANTWYMATVVYDGQTLRMYKNDGAELGNASYASARALKNSTTPIRTGVFDPDNNPQRNFKGRIGHTFVYNDFTGAVTDFRDDIWNNTKTYYGY